METAARRERLEFFAMVSRKRRCRRVLLGHHADDQAETVLWNLLRGSHGLKGMNAESEIMISGTKLLLVRPLLHHRRQYLRDWLLMRGETWREDASNAEPVAIRNRLRSELLPLMEEIVGRDPVKAICRLAKDFSDWEEWANGQLRQQRLMDPQGRIHLGALRQLPETMQRMCVADYLRSQEVKGLSRALLDEVLAMTQCGGAASTNLPGGGRIRRTSGRLWIDRG